MSLKLTLALLLALPLGSALTVLADDAKPAKPHTARPAKEPAPAKGMAKVAMDADTLKAVTALRKELKQYGPKAELSTEQKDKLKPLIVATLRGTLKPSAETIDALAVSLTDDFGSGNLPGKVLEKIQEEVYNTLSGDNVTDAQADKLGQVVRNQLNGSGLKDNAIQALVANVKALVISARNTGPTTTTVAPVEKPIEVIPAPTPTPAPAK